MTRVVIAGVSTRAAAESAARAGYAVTSLDAFGDLDHHPAVRVVSLPRDHGMKFTASAAARAARAIECEAAAYLSSFENHPRAVQSLAAGRMLWGNPPDVLRRVRDPQLLAFTLRTRGICAPRIAPTAVDADITWLVKPLRSGGGRRVRVWSTARPVPRGCVLQEFIEGTPASVVFVAARRRCVPLGVSMQLVGRAALGADGFRYCGNILVGAYDRQLGDETFERVLHAAHVAAEAFDLVGVNGIDVMVRDEVPHVIEVNPRWSASMELVERAYGLSIFGVHAEACTSGSLPDFDLRAARTAQAGAYGKAIVFARHRIVTGDTASWCNDSTVRDVPQCGETIERGEPICTVFAKGADVARCESALITRANAVYDGVEMRAPQPF
jgi:uncharacterized protein